MINSVVEVVKLITKSVDFCTFVFGRERTTDTNMLGTLEPVEKVQH
jgi:hypothetical protein